MTALRAATAGALAVVLVSCTGPAQPAATRSPGPAESAAAAPSPSNTPTTMPTAEPSEPVAQRTEPAPPRLPKRPRLGRVEVKLERVAALRDPTAMAVREGDDAYYVTERAGRIRAVVDGKVSTVLDWRGNTTGGNERGMLGLAFSPDGRHLYVYYIGQQPKHSYLDQYRLRGRRVVPRSRRNILVVKQPPASSVHKGGQVTFGPDGMLYLALGDGGPSDDPPRTSQDLSTLLGKLIRIKPTPDGPKPYRVPRDNPFAGTRKARGEIFATGLRNPWRFSFDAATGDLWIADVGRYVQEEINVRSPAKAPGTNFGWPHFEGTSRRQGRAPRDATAPLHTYLHTDRCAVIGGYVYRGTAVPDLHGAYVYGDYCDGRVRALVRKGRTVVAERALGPKTKGMTSFAVDGDGELYVLSLQRGLLRLVP